MLSILDALNKIQQFYKDSVFIQYIIFKFDLYKAIIFIILAVSVENMFIAFLAGFFTNSISQYILLLIIGGISGLVVDLSCFFIISLLFSKKWIKKIKEKSIFRNILQKTRNNKYFVHLIYRFIPFARIPVCIIFKTLEIESPFLIILFNLIGSFLWCLIFSTLGLITKIYFPTYFKF
jgi:membrane protein DedA with SNARE-associated domain